MRKSIVALLATSIMLFTACSEENEVLETPTLDGIDTLVGTVWEHNETADVFDDNGNPHRYNVLVTLTFQTDTSGLIDYISGEEGSATEQYEENYNFSYSYNAPNGTIKSVYQGEPSSMSFAVQGDEMRVYYDNFTYMVIFSIK